MISNARTKVMPNSRRLTEFVATWGVTLAAAYVVPPWIAPRVFADLELARLAVLFSRGYLIALLGAWAVARYMWGEDERRLAAIEAWGGKTLAATAGFYFVAMSMMSSFKNRAHHTYADMATHLEIFWRAGHGLGLTTALSSEYHHGSHWFAAHFTPISYLFVPFFRILPYAETLYFVQTVALMSSVYPIIRYAQSKLGRDAGYWFGVVFFLYPSLQYTNLYEFEYLRFAIPALCWAYYALSIGDERLYLATTGIALLIREDVGLSVCALGLYAAIFMRRRLLGVTTAVIAFAYTYAAVKWIMPSFRHGDEALGLVIFAQFGSTLREIVFNIVLHPLKAAVYVLSPMKVANLSMYFLPLAFLPVLGVPVVLVALPTIGMLMLNEYMTYVSFILYYLSPAIPFLIFGAIDGAARVVTYLKPRGGDARARGAVLSGLVSCATLSSFWFGALPYSLQFWVKSHRVGAFYTTNFYLDNYLPTGHTRLRNAVIAAVPPDALVAAEQPFLPHLFNRAEMLCFPDDVGRADYVLFDRKWNIRTGCQTTFLDFRNHPEKFYAEIENDKKNWEPVVSRDAVELFRRTDLEAWLRKREAASP